MGSLKQTAEIRVLQESVRALEARLGAIEKWREAGNKPVAPARRGRKKKNPRVTDRVNPAARQAGPAQEEG